MRRRRKKFRTNRGEEQLRVGEGEMGGAKGKEERKEGNGWEAWGEVEGKIKGDEVVREGERWKRERQRAQQGRYLT